jgi:TolB-like protein/Flp pilus assembly protein TadD
MQVKLTLLGRFELRLVNGGAADLRGAKERALLAFLAMAPGSQSRDRLAGLLWGEHGSRQARDSLKQALMRLRRALGSASEQMLKTDRQSISLDRSAIEVDAISLERLVREGSMESLIQAAALYRGAFLDDLVVPDRAFEEWQLVERQRLRDLCEDALARVMTQALSSNALSIAAEAAKQMLQLDPLNEQGYRTLMLVHVDEAQALRLYETLRERLHRELGIQPEPATGELYDEIRRRRASAAPAETAQPATAHADPTEDAFHSGTLRSQRENALAAKPSIAILPFGNLSGDPEQQYFSDGITEDIITELSRFRTLFTIARSSSFRYRGGAVDAVRVGRELGVRYLADGSIRRVGDRVRISARLVDATTGTHLWADHFDRDTAEILAVQDDIVQAIATTLGYRIEAAGRERALHLSPDALSAYDHVLRSEALFLRFTRHENAEARRLAEKAVALDPKSSLAHAQLGWAHCMDYISNWVEDPQAALGAAFAMAQRAVVLDEAECRARWLLGNVHLCRREYDEARAHLRRAIALNPNDVEARATYGFFLIAAGETEAALEQFDLAKRHNPFEFNWAIWYRAIALFTARRYDEAIAVLKQVHNPNNEVRFWLAASYAAAGRLAEARATMADFLAAAEHEMASFPGHGLTEWEPYIHAAIEYRDPADFDHLFTALRAAGMS